jgi:hypothetical protein
MNGFWRSGAGEGESDLVHWEEVGLVEIEEIDQRRLSWAIVGLNLLEQRFEGRLILSHILQDEEVDCVSLSSVFLIWLRVLIPLSDRHF